MPFVAEGGALVTDGRGTMITTRSCLLNPNRNPVRSGRDRQSIIETELAKLGIRQVIWLEGDPCEPITSGHTDGYVLIAPNGVVLVEACDDKAIEPPMWREHDIALLENARDADGRKLKRRARARAAPTLLEGRSRNLRALLSQCLCRQWRGDWSAVRRS